MDRMLEAFLLTSLVLTAGDSARPTVIVMVGAAGEVEYGSQFAIWADRWHQAAQRAEADFVLLGGEPRGALSDHDELQNRIAAEVGKQAPLWIVLIGHGTFDGQVAKFNLRGPDVAATELAEWLAPISRPMAIVNCASSSGPFINALKHPGRVIVTAAKSGHEYNFARFGDYLSSAIGDPSADLDKDEQTSLLEAFLRASARTAEVYAQDGRLATEHALLDDNGDGLGTQADWFRGVRAVRKAKEDAALDGLTANQFQLIPGAGPSMPSDLRARREDLEHEVERLRGSKGQTPPGEYYQKLEPILLQLSELYAELDESPPEPPPRPARKPPGSDTSVGKTDPGSEAPHEVP